MLGSCSLVYEFTPLPREEIAASKLVAFLATSYAVTYSFMGPNPPLIGDRWYAHFYPGAGAGRGAAALLLPPRPPSGAVALGGRGVRGRGAGMPTHLFYGALGAVLFS